MNFVIKVLFLLFILFVPFCQSEDVLIDTFITKTGFLAECQKSVNGGWRNYSCPHKSGLDTLVQIVEADFSYSENVNLQALIDSDAEYSHKNFVVNNWEVFISRNINNGHSLMSVCKPYSCLRILGEHKKLFEKIIEHLKKNA